MTWTPSTPWLPNSTSPFADQNYPNGDRPSGGGDEVWTAITDFDHGNPGILQFATSRVELSATGDATILIERIGGYQGSVSCRVKTNSTTGDMAMTAGTHFTAQDIEVSFDDQQAGVKSITVPVTSLPRAGLNMIVMTLDTPTGSVRLRNPEMHIYVDDGGINPNATIFDGGDSATLQATINAGGAGKLYYFRDNNGVFSSNQRLSGRDYGGFYITSGGGGTQFAKTVLSAYPSESPIIDQLYAGTSDSSGTDTTVGFFSEADYVHFKGFEITKTLYCGVMTIGTVTTGVVVEDCTIHDLANPAGGIGDYPGTSSADNIGGIRLDNSVKSIQRNNTIYEVYDPRPTTTSPVTGLNTNPYTAYAASFHAGIHGYYLSEPWIHNNTLYHVQKAIYPKQPNILGDFGHRVHDNYFYELDEVALAPQIAGAGLAAASDVHFYRNLMDFSNANCANVDAVNMSMPYDETTTDPDNFWFFNNTQIDGRDFISGRDADNMVAYSNIQDGASRFWIIDGRSTNLNDIAYSDYNAFPNGVAFLTNRNVSANNYANLTAWRAAYPSDTQLLRDCDENSITTTPTYVNSGAGDYRTTSGVTETAGRFSQNIGIGSTVTGAQ